MTRIQSRKFFSIPTINDIEQF
ncbi:hypothetical protein GRA97_18245, partial [Bacillus anthracis]|nr:hypothetical protein [Bacillus anthracis]